MALVVSIKPTQGETVGLEVKWAPGADQGHLLPPHLHHWFARENESFPNDSLPKEKLMKGWWAFELGLGQHQYSKNKKHCEIVDVAGYWFLKGSESGHGLHCSHPSIHMLHLEMDAKCPVPWKLLPILDMTLHPGLYASRVHDTELTSALLKFGQSLAMKEHLALLFILYSLHSSHTACFTLHLQFALLRVSFFFLNASGTWVPPHETAVQKLDNKNEELIIPCKPHGLPQTTHLAQWHKVDVERIHTESLNKIIREVTTPVPYLLYMDFFLFRSSLSPSLPLFPIFIPRKATVSSKF